jgi:hypothetical protein
MISVLIPVFNYKVQPLVDCLILQLTTENIHWEISLSDDCSRFEYKKENSNYIRSLLDLPVYYFEQSVNIGNGSNRNFLISKANYDWILFLDVDVLPVHSNFIAIYIKYFTEYNYIIAGDILYDESNKMPKLLRWVYGIKKEQQSLKERSENTNLHARGANFAIKKNVAQSFPFPILHEKYGFIDTRFFLQFSMDKIKMIENPVFHLGIESNDIFLNKTKMAVANALYLFKKRDGFANQISIVAFYKRIYLLKWFLGIGYCLTNKFIEKNILSDKPSIHFFELYKLLYLGYLDSFKNIH